jgi:hypothetical protein
MSMKMILTMKDAPYTSFYLYIVVDKKGESHYNINKTNKQRKISHIMNKIITNIAVTRID